MAVDLATSGSLGYGIGLQAKIPDKTGLVLQLENQRLKRKVANSSPNITNQVTCPNLQRRSQARVKSQSQDYLTTRRITTSLLKPKTSSN